MTHVSITVDGDVKFKGELGEWVSSPPDFIKERIRPGFVPESWAKAVMMAVTDALMRDRGIDIEVETFDTGWQMKVMGAT